MDGTTPRQMTVMEVAMNYKPWRLCPESVLGAHDPQRDGRCAWCGRRVEPPVSRPDSFPVPTEMDDAYDRFYDPDWGGHNEKHQPRPIVGYPPWEA